jgi:hypothetical protein
MTERETSTSALTQASFDYNQLADVDRRFVQERAQNIARLWQQTTANVLRIGKELTEVKERLPHGSWLPWLDAEFGWGETHARRFMQAHEVFGKTPILEDLARRMQPSTIYELAAPSMPQEARDEALAKAAAGEPVKHRDVKQIIARHKQPLSKPQKMRRQWDEMHKAKRERVDGVDFEFRQDQHGYVHRDPISQAVTKPKREPGPLMSAVMAAAFEAQDVLRQMVDVACFAADDEAAARSALLEGLRRVAALMVNVEHVLEPPLEDPVRPPATPTDGADDEWSRKGAAIRAARISRGLNAKQLAKLAGIAPNYVSMAELGRLTRSGGPAAGRPTFAKLEAALGLEAAT